ncbi:MAG: DUF3387 domain-containing protein, partial [Alistipes sp.]
DFDAEDFEGTYTDITEEVAKLPQRHSELCDIFKSIANKRDLDAYGDLLRAEDIRARFYEKLTAYAKCLKIALSSIEFHKATAESEISKYKEDLAMFLKLRSAVQERYSDTIDYKQYEGQIQKLIDTHIESGEVKIITELVNIFDKERFAEEVEKITGKAAKADTIASRTARHITENMDTDPVFYKKFSQLLKETIAAYEQGRINEIEYLRQVTEYMDKVLSHTDSDIPASIQDNNAARAYFGLSFEVYKAVAKDIGIDLKALALETANTIDSIIKRYVTDNEKTVVDWQNKGQLIGKMKIEIEDYLIDEVKRKYEIPMTFDDMDMIIDRCTDVAKLWFKQ